MRTRRALWADLSSLLSPAIAGAKGVPYALIGARNETCDGAVTEGGPLGASPR